MNIARTESYHLGNYAALHELEPQVLETNRGRFALVHERKVIGFFETNREALAEAYKKQINSRVSVLRVETSLEDLGFFSCAPYPR